MILIFLLLRILIRQSYVVSSLTGLRDNISGRPKSTRNRSLIEKIKCLLYDCDSPTQQLFTIEAGLKHLHLRSTEDQYTLIGVDKESYTLSKLQSNSKIT